MELSQEQLNELKDLLKPKEQPIVNTAAPQEFQIRVGDQNYIVRNQDEAQRLFDQYEAQQSQALEAERVKALALEQRAQQFESTQQRQTRTATGDNFDKEEYARLFLDDPRKANRYALQHDPEQVQFYQGLVSQLSAVKQEAAASQFLLQHRDDYNPTEKNYKAIEGLIAQYNLPWNLQGMNLAFQVAKAQGQIEALEEPETQQRRGQAQQQRLEQEDGEESFVPAPRLRRKAGGASDEDIAERFSQLGPAEQKKYLESLLPTR